ncbi:MAG: butyrate kinase [Bacteroidetes bacterium]|nr:butyrate kinase [Bacteroidota bacterium]MBL6943419.1 butyrate kinase [Bacteroidales bacterium]
MINKNILIIYPEVGVTKIAVYRSAEPIFLKTILHSEEDIRSFKHFIDQIDFRLNSILKELTTNNIKLDNIEIVMGRSGLIKPVKQGVYEITPMMVEDLKKGVMGIHATNLGGLLAFSMAQKLGKKAYMANPVVVDELSDVARITGHPRFKRKSIFHALNHKFVSNQYARSVHKKYEDLNLIVCHIGTGGISIGAHEKGKVVDVNQAFNGGGPFSITRTGTLPMGQLVELCFSGELTKDEVMEMITAKGGYYAYLSTSSISKINQRIADGDEEAMAISYALSYQVSKEIASHYATLKGEVDCIILTGIIFDSEQFLTNVKSRVGGLAPIALYPSVNDFAALASFGMMVLKNEIEVSKY